DLHPARLSDADRRGVLPAAAGEHDAHQALAARNREIESSSLDLAALRLVLIRPLATAMGRVPDRRPAPRSRRDLTCYKALAEPQHECMVAVRADVFVEAPAPALAHAPDHAQAERVLAHVEAALLGAAQRRLALVRDRHAQRRDI